MSYLFATEAQRAQMLQAVGVPSLETLLNQVPAELQMQRPLDLPEPKTELALEQELRQTAALSPRRICFLGGGAYDHYIPAVVDEVTGRGEFYTAYTPYQPEASQGSLQAFFEYQSLICQLTGMDVSNASLYEGGTAVSEAVFMAMRVNGRESRIVLCGAVNPQYRQTVETYLEGLNCEVVTVPVSSSGTTDLTALKAAVNDQTACVVFQSPNYLGCIEDSSEITRITQAAGALAVMSFDPISLGILKRPGDFGVDIAVAEGQSLGTPLQYGGPYLGILACRQDFVRKMPGRLIAQTVDRDGKTCYVLGLQTREQHIRRDKATSNICTNQGLLALRATVYMSLLGPQGLREAAELACRNAHYAAQELAKVPGVTVRYAAPFFKEFVIEVQGAVAGWVAKAQRAGFDIGPELDAIPGAGETSRQLLIAVTESRTKAEIDGLVAALKS